MLEQSRKLNDPALLDAVISEAAFPQGRRGFLPFRLVSSLALCGDLILIIGISELTGIVYQLILFSTAEPLGTFFAVGVLTAANFTAVLAARGAYQPNRLADFQGQLRETTGVWLLTFLLLVVAAFSLKVSDSYSRVATYTSFAIGWFCITAYRLALSLAINRALSHGGFAEQKIILVAEEGQLTNSGIIDSLSSCGYYPARTFEFSSNKLSSPAAASKLFK